MDCGKGVYFVVLAVIALTLGGCGSSSNGNSPAPPPQPAVSLDFVSQSVTGIQAESVFINGTTEKPVGGQGPLSIFLDVQQMSVRLDTALSTTFQNISISATASAIVSVADKRITAYYNFTNPFDPSNPVETNCTYKVIDQIPSADLLRNLIKSELTQQTVMKDSDTGFNKIQHTLDPAIIDPKAKGNFLITVEMDDASVLRKVLIDGNVSGPASVSEKSSYTAKDAKAGTPDASHFTVPKSWGKCYESPKLQSGSPALERFETLLTVIEQYIVAKGQAQSESTITI